MHKCFGSIFLALFLSLSCTARATSFIDLDAANSYLQHVQATLPNNVSMLEMQSMLNNLEQLRDQANNCIDHANAQLKAITVLEADTGISDDVGPVPTTEDIKYIQDKKVAQANRLAACRLFEFKTQDVILDLKNNINLVSDHDVFATERPIWEVFTGPYKNYSEIIHILFLSAVTMLTAWFLWVLPRLGVVKIFDPEEQMWLSAFYRAAILLSAITVITMSMIGYRHLAIFLCQGVLLSIGYLIIFVFLVYLGNTLLDQEKIHRAINPNKKYNFIEFTLFKFSLYALLAGYLVLSLLQWWGVSIVMIENFKNFLLDGFTIYSIKIIPMRLIMALMVFSVIQMSWKYALLYASRVHQFDIEGDAQVVITSLISYIVLAIAIVCGLAVSGVDFTGLAIVAGALSVGIGLGLQNIVNNFVSGIILLIEKPIKPGDRVLIKDHEGFVKKISFRYTRILTLSKEDVIIPNSDLISSPIVNFVFNDTLAKFYTKVGVAYGSDLEQVKQILLNVALKHPDILRDPVNQPIVYLVAFGESSVCFELICVVHDVNKRSDISSEINFMIAKAFKENGIVMPFPQREVRIIGQES